MVTLLWTLLWLPLALTAPTQPPQPINLSVTSDHFVHVLKWAPGPAMPPDVHYSVTFITDRGSVWRPVPGCEQVQYPLVCDLTKTFKQDEIYFIKVTALLEDQVLGSEDKRFHPIRETHLDLPLLTLTPCGRNLCVDLHPPVEDLRNIYSSLYYSLRIWTNGVEHTKDVKFLNREVLKDLHPGREYCVSVCFSDSLVQKQSNYSRPVCDVAPGNQNEASGTLLAGVLCAVLLVTVVMVVWLAAAGYICPIRMPLPQVLVSVRHVDVSLVFPGSSLTSLLTVEATAPPAGKQQTLSEEDSEEQMTESSGGSGSRRVYMLWDGCEQLSSSALEPTTSARVLLIRPSCQTYPQPPAGGLTSAEPPRRREAPEEYVSGGEAQEEEEKEERGSSQDVNLLTLTFGMQPEDKLASSSSEDVTLEPPAPTGMFCPAEEQQQQEEEAESGYMCR